MHSHPVEPRDVFKSQNGGREEECDGGRGGENEVYRLIRKEEENKDTERRRVNKDKVEEKD